MIAPARSREVSPDELRRQRAAAGLSTYELAGLLEVSPAAVQHWEAGRKPVPQGRVSELRRTLASRRAPVTITALPGAELRDLRERASFSQADVAHLLGVKQQAVASWEQGARPVPEARRDDLRDALRAENPTAALMRAQRDRAGWKQAELAARIGSSQSQVSAWERGAQPIPREEWPRIRDVLAAAEPDIRPVHFQQPVTPEEIQEGVRRLNWTLGRLAEALKVPRGTVGPWASGASPVPPGRREQVREVLGTSPPASLPAERDRVAEALALILPVVEREPGLQRSEVMRRVDAPEPHARAAIARALEQDRIHERPVPRRRASGGLRALVGLFAGPRPAIVPRVDLVSFVVPEVLPAVKATPGRTRRQVAESLPHDRRLGERAIARALRQGTVHERGIAVRQHGRASVRVGLFAGDTPPPAPAIPGAVLRQLRERLVLGQAELAERLDVKPQLVRRWERSEVPAAWREAIGEVLRPVAAEADARETDLRRRIVEAIRAQPGQPRWGDLARRVRLPERRELRRLLDELVEAGEVHELPENNGHGGGLFAGPAPPGWEPGPPIIGEQLRAMRDWAGVSQKELAARVGASVASVNAWERGTKPVPAYRRAQLRRVLAERKPPEPPPIPVDELLAERKRTGLSQAALAQRLGVQQGAVSAWERGRRPVPVELREPMRQLFATTPTLPVIRGAELRRFRRSQGLTSQALAELIGGPRSTVVEWQQRGVPRDRAAAVRELLDRMAEPAQVSLFGG